MTKTNTTKTTKTTTNKTSKAQLYRLRASQSQQHRETKTQNQAKAKANLQRAFNPPLLHPVASSLSRASKGPRAMIPLPLDLQYLRPQLPETITTVRTMKTTTKHPMTNCKLIFPHFFQLIFPHFFSPLPSPFESHIQGQTHRQSSKLKLKETKKKHKNTNILASSRGRAE